MKNLNWKEMSPARKAAISLPLALILLIIISYGWFAGIYKTPTWPWNPPEAVHVQGRSYTKSPAPAVASVPDDFVKIGSLKPFWYEILGSRGYDTSTLIYIHWRDQEFYPYSLVGGP